MNRSLVPALMMKDWRLYQVPILLCVVGGVVALAFSQWGNEPTLVVGTVAFFVAMILAATLFPLAGIVNERKNHHLAFMMSLPVTFLEYTTAKLISTLVIFLIPWLTLLIAGLSVIEFRHFIPHGTIPLMLIFSLMPFVGMCVITAAALIGETEGWGIAANVVCNSSYGLIWYFIARNPALMDNARGPVAVWNSAALNFLAAEFVLIVVILALTYYLQSRKRDFV